MVRKCETQLSVNVRRKCRSLPGVGHVTCLIDRHFNLALSNLRRIRGDIELDEGGMLLASSTSS